MNEVGRTAIRIGEQMESVHQQRQRAQAAYDLIDYYNQFAKDDTTRLDALKKEGKEGRRKVAVLLRRLATVAKEVDLPHSDKVRVISSRATNIYLKEGTKTRENIDRYCEKFEKDMLHLFDRAYRRGDPKMMHVCILHSFVSSDRSLLTIPIALCANTTRLQWRCFLRASLCEPTRLLHQ